MPLDAIKIIIEEKPEIIEISPEEYEMIMRAREKKLKAKLQEAYIAEFNDLLTRMKADGFYALSNGGRTVQRAEVWKCDTENHFIDIIA